jgi:hypothetical protein
MHDMLKFLPQWNASSILAWSKANQWSSFYILVINQISEHLFILLDQSTAAVIAQNAKENILIVGEMCLV